MNEATWQPIPELFELVTWDEIRKGDHVWSMGGVCLITRARFRDDAEYDRCLDPGWWRFEHRNESGSEFAPPFNLADRVPRLIPPGRGLTENDARAALSATMAGFRQDMLSRDQDITDNAVWRPAKREFLRWLIRLLYRELRNSPDVRRWIRY